MDKELKAKWVAALRSGEYKQGIDRLCTQSNDPNVPNEYCCLGVLAKVAGYTEEQMRGAGSFCTFKPDNPESFHGVPVFVGGITHGHNSVLVAMNDSGKTFAEIADYIEANL